ncbi:MAG TPA: aminoacyl-histidine dipeptidase [Bacteroidales bacterium]|nr:aminoacyl-histidine dipeptidase [Bacteroidales bacterium]
MDQSLTSLQPQNVWHYFEEICKIPRPSKNEAQIRNYLLEFAKLHHLEANTDDAGNVVIRKEAKPGFEDKPIVILQSHMDMVCEKNQDSLHNFEIDAIQPYIDGEWVKARNTTLGADDGIGMAAQLAILESDDIPHGSIECLFTVDEETGLTGASAIQPGFLKGRILINLDSEDEGELFIGCAGGIDTLAELQFKRRVVPVNYLPYRIKVTGLKGGHSGDDIHKGRGNANKILNRFLWNASNRYNIRLAQIDGGNLRNAIPREAEAVILVPFKTENMLLEYFKEFYTEMVEELKYTEPHFCLTLESTTHPEAIINKKSQQRLLNAIYACPHGVISMSQRMPGMVETSTNLASIKITGPNTLAVNTSQRSDLESAKTDIASMVESVFLLAKFKVTHSDGYPGWTPNPSSRILNTTIQSYKNLFGNEPRVRSIHAGLECGLFLKKYPYLDMVSFGPTLRDVHSPDEKIHIPSDDKFWKLILETLKNVS